MTFFLLGLLPDPFVLTLQLRSGVNTAFNPLSVRPELVEGYERQ